MKTIVDQIRSEMVKDRPISKPRAGKTHKVKGWGRRRNEEALIYKMPSHTVNGKEHEKGITVGEWERAFKRLIDAGDFTREWFNNSMSACSKEGPCNFTTIGGVFVCLGWAKYERKGTYRLLNSPDLSERLLFLEF